MIPLFVRAAIYAWLSLDVNDDDGEASLSHGSCVNKPQNIAANLPGAWTSGSDLAYKGCKLFCTCRFHWTHVWYRAYEVKLGNLCFNDVPGSEQLEKATRQNDEPLLEYFLDGGQEEDHHDALFHCENVLSQND